MMLVLELVLLWMVSNYPWWLMMVRATDPKQDTTGDRIAYVLASVLILLIGHITFGPKFVWIKRMDRRLKAALRAYVKDGTPPPADVLTLVNHLASSEQKSRFPKEWLAEAA